MGAYPEYRQQPQYRRRRGFLGPRMLMALAIAAFGLCTYYSQREENPITGEVQSIALSPDQEGAMGLQSAPEMAAQFGGLDPDPELQELVRSVGARIVTSTVASQTPYQFSFNLLADDQTVNAFALPGGPIFITRALLLQLENEAQLAGVLGHEVGHVLGRHAAERISKAQLAQTLVGAAGVAGSEDGRGQAAAMAASVVAQMLQLKYGRQDELQSDALGLKLMADSGYDPRELIGVMRILAAASGGQRQAEWMSSHPDPGNRAQRIQELIAEQFPSGVPASLSKGMSFRG
jgi:predicted Zn-dependent protease